MPDLTDSEQSPCARLRETNSAQAPAVVDRRDGPYGEVVLRRHGGLLQIIANGCFLMDTSDGRSERLLVTAALDRLLGRGHLVRPRAADGPPLPASPDRPSVLIGGLGVGFSLAEAANDARWGRITVVEREPAVLEWHRDGGPLAAFSTAARADPRVRIVRADLLEHLRDAGDRYDALCLDVDNGPEWTVTDGNDGLYSPSGLAAAHSRLRAAGVLAVWSAQPSASFGTALRSAGFRDISTVEVPVARGVPDVIHLARRTP